MLAAPIPPDDEQRLQNLQSYFLLDTPFEQVFDEIATLAANICGMPYAMISIVDKERQWFKAAHGLTGVRETPRDISFCGHAIFHDQVFYVPDTSQDERFRDNPLVTGEMSLKVYAGMPISSEEGYKLGTLCVMSDRPTPLDKWQMESLKQLSHVLTALLKARKEEARLAALGLVMDQLNDAIVLADPRTLECTYANAAARKTFLPMGGDMTRLRLPDLIQVFASPEKRQMIEALQSGRRRRVTFELECMNPGADGAPETAMELRLQVLTSGHRPLLAAIGHDISERRKLDQTRSELHDTLTQHNRELSMAYGQLNDELAIAREMQLRFLPSPKCIDKVRFDWLFQSSSYLGGDIFDYFPLDSRYLCFHVIDVAGHGVAAALLAFNAQRQMFSARSRTTSLIRKLNGDIAQAASMVVKEFNQKFAGMSESSLYLTMVFGILDSETGQVALVQAGHPPPFLSGPEEKSLVAIGEGGLPIGILEDADFEAHLLQMEPGARLYLYSDGVTDCENAIEEAFGRERMEELLQEKRGAPLPEVRDAVGNALLEWRGGVENFEDDVTFLSIEYLMANQATSMGVNYR